MRRRAIPSKYLATVCVHRRCRVQQARRRTTRIALPRGTQAMGSPHKISMIEEMYRNGSGVECRPESGLSWPSGPSLGRQLCGVSLYCRRGRKLPHPAGAGSTGGWRKYMAHRSNADSKPRNLLALQRGRRLDTPRGNPVSSGHFAPDYSGRFGYDSIERLMKLSPILMT